MFARPNFHPAQAEANRRIQAFRGKYVVLNLGRFWGKNYLLAPYAINEIGRNQTKSVWLDIEHSNNLEMQEIIENADVGNLFDYRHSSPLDIRYGKAKMVFHSFQNKKAMRGKNRYETSFINEAAYIPDIDWYGTISQTLNMPNRVYLASTPCNQWWADFCETAKNDPTNYLYIHGTSVENPHLDLIKLESDRLSMPPNIFRREYLAEFVDNMGGVFTELDRFFALDDFAQPTEVNYAGIDLAALSDFTVIHILNEFGQTVYHDRFNRLDWSEIESRLIEPLQRFNCICFAEDNGVGASTVQAIKKESGQRVFAFTSTNEKKSKAIGQLNLSLRSGKLQTVKTLSTLRTEMINFKYKISESGNTLYSHAVGYHDDEVDALFLANHCLITRNK